MLSDFVGFLFDQSYWWFSLDCFTSDLRPIGLCQLGVVPLSPKSCKPVSCKPHAVLPFSIPGIFHNMGLRFVWQCGVWPKPSFGCIWFWYLLHENTVDRFSYVNMPSYPIVQRRDLFMHDAFYEKYLVCFKPISHYPKPQDRTVAQRDDGYQTQT